MISFQLTSESEAGLWILDLDFHCKVFAFCILYCHDFWPRISWSIYIVNLTYLIGCCDWTLINLLLKTIVLILNISHKRGCCEYWYWLGWYKLWRVKSGSLNYPIINSRVAVHGRYYITRLFSRQICTYNNFCCSAQYVK